MGKKIILSDGTCFHISRNGMKYFLLIIVFVLLFLSGCGMPSAKLVRYSVTPISTQIISTLEASIIKSTPRPYPEYQFSQEVEDLVDSAEASFSAAIAVRRLEKAIAKNMPGIQIPSVYLTLGMRYEDLGETQKAIDSYTKCIELYNDDPFAHLYRGELYYQQGDLDNARLDIEKFLSLDLDDKFYSYEKNSAYEILWDITNRQ